MTKIIRQGEISYNYYDGIDIPEAIDKGLDMVEALTVSEGQNRCPVHREAFIRYNPTFRAPQKSIGMYLYFCPKCNRLFVKESQYKENIKKLTECNVEYNFYDKKSSENYLKSITEPYLLREDEKIYMPNVWIEENPICVIHDCMLEEIPCKIDYCGRSVYFDAYYCDECDKVILRNAAARDLEDKCSQMGIPLAGFENLKIESRPKKPVEKRNHFISQDSISIIEDGKLIPPPNNITSPEQYILDESDTVVISDSIYCNLDGHDTEEVVRIIFIMEKRDGKRNPYLFRLGYCADCEKYYMDEIDYKTLYNIGRPEVSILLDVDDEPYMITSGAVFDREKNHLEDLEGKINCEIDNIHNKPDYVGQYETQSSYDDGGLAHAKDVSLRKHEPRLEKLNGHIDCPYTYRVDISCDDKTETYYIGSADVILDGNKYVISANDDFAKRIVNLGTTKVEKEGLEYSITLNREFDISKANLYGYDNLRTSQDLIFRKGVTDPFLIRVLKKRKQQHNLVDIFATIQENQNAIVDAKFRKNIIVQGCAGSGKTMVLLHRLSSLNYNRPDFNFVQNAVILTPNDNFTTHIDGLASSLQIGAVERLSVEKYYARILLEYSKDIAPTGAISSEMLVDQKLVDYIYSDGFRTSFDDAYEEIITGRNKLIGRLHDAEILMEEQIRDINEAVDSEVIPQLSKAVSLLSEKITNSEKNISGAQKSLDALYGEKKRMEEELPQKQTSLSQSLRKLAANSRAKGLAAIAMSQRDLTDKKKGSMRQTKQRQN